MTWIFPLLVALCAVPRGAWAVSGSACLFSGCAGGGGISGLACAAMNTEWCYSHQNANNFTKGGIQVCSGPDANSTSTTCAWPVPCAPAADGCCAGLVMQFNMEKPLGAGCTGCNATCVPYPGPGNRVTKRVEIVLQNAHCILH